MDKWYTWVFSGIGVFLIPAIIKFVWSLVRKNHEKTNDFLSNSQMERKSFPTSQDTSSSQSVIKERRKYPLDELKLKTNILFIDDESFKIVNILRKTEGWVNTHSVKDVKSLNDLEIKRAHIIFVDINGIGGALYNDQGLGVAKGIKEKYPEKKVIIYSAESKHNAFSESWEKVDGRLNKNVDPIQFISKVEFFANMIFNEETNNII